MPIPLVVGQWNKAGLNKLTRHIAPWMPGLGLVVHDETRHHIRLLERQVLGVLGVADFLSLKNAPAPASPAGQ